MNPDSGVQIGEGGPTWLCSNDPYNIRIGSDIATYNTVLAKLYYSSHSPDLRAWPMTFTSAAWFLLSAVGCGGLEHPRNGMVSTPRGTIFPEAAFYVCDLGYRLSGDDVRTCTADRVWSGMDPSCESKLWYNFV